MWSCRGAYSHESSCRNDPSSSITLAGCGPAPGFGSSRPRTTPVPFLAAETNVFSGQVIWGKTIKVHSKTGSVSINELRLTSWSSAKFRTSGSSPKKPGAQCKHTSKQSSISTVRLAEREGCRVGRPVLNQRHGCTLVLFCRQNETFASRFQQEVRL